eukprot:CAMPEP_0196593918 /NCGR_PEP_ID=MMETSP1081-20130531/76919_1 /TAXON_ID=36882 /ORGANISM="Pyramimonas amylifera, Strain CCMP720" /LENGTH=368 /DNA_ID=CAMNT_0041918045 /DNA_START=167 /DNA_END=1273 /DNA_ORIENTATION=+
MDVLQAKNTAFERAQRREMQKRYVCGGCQKPIRDLSFKVHMQNCCPDLLGPLVNAPWPGSEVASQAALLQEADNMRRAVQLRFVGERKHSEEESAAALQIPLRRLRDILRKASKSIPLVVDEEMPEVIYEDDDLVAVNKPPHLRFSPPHRFVGLSLLNRMIGYLGPSWQTHVVHRLDMDTSGVALFAKRASAAKHLSMQFQDRMVSKEYLAICLGTPPAQLFEVAAPIGPHPELQERRAVCPGGLPSLTTCEVIDQGTHHGRPVCIILAKPHTGRTHQIRLHLAHVGLPIVGDIQYLPASELELSTVPRLIPHPSRQALHAFSIQFTHPSSNKTLVLDAPIPKDMRKTAQELNLRWDNLSTSLQQLSM